jgi:HK97 family phage major capsid protein
MTKYRGTKMDEKIQELRDSLLDINEQTQVIQAQADAEKRDLLEDEQKSLDTLFARFEATEDEIERRERINAQTSKLMESAGRVTEPQMPEPQNQPRDPEQRQSRRDAMPRIQVIEDRGKWGWRSFGEFAAAIVPASSNGGTVDPRLVMNAPTTYSSEGVGADGGFAVPPDFRTAIMEKVMGEDSLLGRTDQLTTSSNSITFPKDETTPWDSSGGLQAYWDGEGDTITQSKVALKEHTVRLNKLTALVPVTEELMDDAPSLDAYLRRRVPEKFDFKLNNAIVNGTGSGQPTGILSANSLVSVAKDTSTSPVQPADTLRYKNITAMYARMYAPLRSNAVWLANQDIEPQLLNMEFPTTTGASAVPAYMPAGGLSASPYATLMGRPVIYTQACQTLGDKGDIIFVSLESYLTAVKTGGVRTDVSMHLYFDTAHTAFRFLLRVAGEPWWNASVDALNGSNTYSWAITLDART